MRFLSPPPFYPFGLKLANFVRVLAISLVLSGSLTLCSTGYPAESRDPREDREIRLELCPSVVLVGEVRPPLSSVEKRLVCGDPQVEAWKEIPKNQARFELSIFLQDRALFHAVYEEQKDRLIAVVGLPTLVSSLSAEGGPPDLELERKRGIVGQRLTPALLNTIEQWTLKRLGSIGFACPKVKSEADPDTGEIRLHIDPGLRQNLVSITESGTPGLLPGVLRRYDAFHLGGPFNAENLAVTSNRIVGQGLFDSSFFIPSCTEQGAKASQEIVSSPPHLLSFGVGLNTEEIVVGRARWTATRLGNKASDVSVQLYASARSQQISSFIDGYVFDPGSRQAIRPYVSLDHENWDAYETGTFSAQLGHETSWDGDKFGFKVITGPEMDVIRTYRGSGPTNSHFLSMVSNLSFMTHDYESGSFSNDPRTGYSATATLALSDGSVFSSTSAQRLDLRWEGLWNYKNYDSPVLIFGLRLGFDTTITGDRPSFSDIYGFQVPLTYLHFLGGSQDLRGFGVQELPIQPPGFTSQNQIGSLSSTFASFEVRLASILPPFFSLNAQPIVFTDAGALGNVPWRVMAPIYWDPGAGFRVQSPIGAFRATIAHGFIGSNPDHDQFYFSYGQEF